MNKPGTVACAVILATGTVDIGCLRWQATPRGPCWLSLASAPASLTWNLKGKGLNPPLELPISDFMSASMLFNSICIKDMIGSCRPGFNPRYRQNFSVGIFQDLSTLEDFNWIVSMVQSDLMDIYNYGQQLWVKVQVGFGTRTCKAAANRSNVYVSGKNNKIRPIPETMQGISTSAESKEERSKKK